MQMVSESEETSCEYVLSCFSQLLRIEISRKGRGRVFLRHSSNATFS